MQLFVAPVALLIVFVVDTLVLLAGENPNRHWPLRVGLAATFSTVVFALCFLVFVLWYARGSTT